VQGLDMILQTNEPTGMATVAGLLYHLVSSSLRLEGLTCWLIGLTNVLAVLTAILTVAEGDRFVPNGLRLFQ
jgi:hypothetical protein